MTVFRHEIRQGKNLFLIWTGAVSFMMLICILIYPDMKGQMSEINDLFANMGSFSSAFGIDKINFGEFIGYFGVECGNMLGIGGALFAAFVSVSVWSKEEKDHTSDFLYSHPQTRIKTVSEKYLSSFVQILSLNAVSMALSLLGIAIVGESIDSKIFVLIFVAYTVMQLEIASICFVFSSVFCRGNIGIGLGITVLFYFLNLISNITEKAEFLKYLTPFGYTDTSYIITNQSIEIKFLIIGIAVTVICIGFSLIYFDKKDIK